MKPPAESQLPSHRKGRFPPHPTAQPRFVAEALDLRRTGHTRAMGKVYRESLVVPFLSKRYSWSFHCGRKGLTPLLLPFLPGSQQRRPQGFPYPPAHVPPNHCLLTGTSGMFWGHTTEERTSRGYHLCCWLGLSISILPKPCSRHLDPHIKHLCKNQKTDPHNTLNRHQM